MRFHDWPQRLDAFIASRIAEPFAYGTHDCCAFSARCVEALTGTNPAAAWHYANELGAARLMREAGGLEALITQALGPPVHPSRAGRGDVVLAELENGPTVGVCVGRDCAFAAAPAGLAMRPRTVILVAWRIP